MVTDFVEPWGRGRGQTWPARRQAAAGPGRTPQAFPPMNVSVDDEAFILRAELPGLEPGDIQVELVGQTLTIRGERQYDEAKYYMRERPSGNFLRRLSLGAPVDRDGVKATMALGILEVRVPKAPEAKPRKIEIEA